MSSKMLSPAQVATLAVSRYSQSYPALAEPGKHVQAMKAAIKMAVELQNLDKAARSLARDYQELVQPKDPFGVLCFWMHNIAGVMSLTAAVSLARVFLKSFKEVLTSNRPVTVVKAVGKIWLVAMFWAATVWINKRPAQSLWNWAKYKVFQDPWSLY